MTDRLGTLASLLSVWSWTNILISPSLSFFLEILIQLHRVAVRIK